MATPASGGPAATGSALRPQRTRLNNGLVLLHNRAAANPSVVVRALIRAGSSRESASEHGIAGLTGRMLRQGTENIGKSALAEELDGMGAGLSVDVGYALVVISIKCLSERPSRSSFHTTKVSFSLAKAMAAPSSGRSFFAPLPTSMKIFSQPALFRASSCRSRFWSEVETRAYPISILSPSGVRDYSPRSLKSQLHGTFVKR